MDDAPQPEEDDVMAQFEKLQEVWDSLVNYEANGETIDFMCDDSAMERRVVHQGMLTKKAPAKLKKDAERYIFLLSDMMLVTKQAVSNVKVKGQKEKLKVIK